MVMVRVMVRVMGTVINARERDKKTGGIKSGIVKSEQKKI
jgi:hypothetical protein